MPTCKIYFLLLLRKIDSFIDIKERKSFTLLLDIFIFDAGVYVYMKIIWIDLLNKNKYII